jgi:hypothetical protein
MDEMPIDAVADSHRHIDGDHSGDAQQPRLDGCDQIADMKPAMIGAREPTGLAALLSQAQSHPSEQLRSWTARSISISERPYHFLGSDCSDRIPTDLASGRFYFDV